MGSDFQHPCQVESRKVVWLIGLVLGSIFVIQYFELPYRESMLSLLSSGKAYFNISSNATKGVDQDLVYSGKESNGRHNSSASMPESEDNMFEQHTTPMNLTIDEETILRSASRPTNVDSDDISPSVSVVVDDSTVFKSGQTSGFTASPENFDVFLAPSETISRRKTDISPSAFTSSQDVFLAPTVSPSESVFSPQKTDIAPTEASGPPNETSSNEKSDKNTSPPPEEKPKKAEASVVSISEMNDLLLHSRASSFSKSPLWPSSADQELLDARFKIEHEAVVKNPPGLYAPIYRNLSTFVRSYELMEQKLKIFIYNEGKKPVFHQPRLKGIYASEGWFMKHLQASHQFLTSNPEEAHLFYLPFSSQLLVDYVYVPDSHSFDLILEFLKNYLDSIKAKHSFWNRTDGADHFVVACHDWAAFETRRLMPTCIRAICNSDVKEGFQFGKDVSLPETFVHSPQNPLQEIGGNPSSERKILAFFAGQMHGNVRPVLLKHWENKDPDMKIFGRLRKGYNWHMKNSRYCICAKGYEVNSPRVVEAIIYGCVPVIISDNFVPPFFDVLNWESFAVFVAERDIPNLKNILVSVSERRYVVMQQRVKQVRQHFLWHNTPVKYDIFHMILHSIWFNRLFRLSPH